MQSITSNKKMTDSILLQEILEMIKTTPNDMVLGEKVRKLYTQSINSEK
jgi:hypothetical protein